MIRISKNRVLEFLIYIEILTIFLPAAEGHLSESFFDLLRVVLLMMVVALQLWDKRINQKVCISLLSFVMFAILLYFGMWSTRYQFLNFLFSELYAFQFLLIAFSVETFDKKAVKRIIIFFLLIYEITAITTIIGLETNPLAARMLAFSSDTEISLKHKNIGGYSFIYSSVVLFPYLLFMVKERKKRFLGTALIVTVAIMIIQSQYTLALFLFVFAIFVTVVFSADRRYMWPSLFLLIIFLLVFVFFRDNVLTFLYKTFDEMKLDYLSTRIRELIKANGGSAEGDLYARLKLYNRSANSFIRSPIWGNIGGNNLLGGHSEILDDLAACGILGICLLYIPFKSYKSISVDSKFKYNRYIVSSICCFIILSFINTSYKDCIVSIMCLAPSLLTTIEHDNEI